jgi:hypothetical protein
MREAAHRPMLNPSATVTLAATKLGLGEDEKTGVFDRLIKDGDFTQWGLVNAITRYSQDVDSYERANDLEGFGGEILAMDAPAWKNMDLTLATALS